MQYQVLNDSRAGISFFYELADARQSHGDERKLRGREKRVDADQKKYAEKAN
jgi:hypothetical protein